MCDALDALHPDALAELRRAFVLYGHREDRASAVEVFIREDCGAVLAHNLFGPHLSDIVRDACEVF